MDLSSYVMSLSNGRTLEDDTASYTSSLHDTVNNSVLKTLLLEITSKEANEVYCLKITVLQN
jgi:hypothetical protein